MSKTKVMILIFFIIVLISFFPQCSPQKSSNICDPASKTFYQTIFLKLALSDKNSICGIPPVGFNPFAAKDITSYSIPSLGITGIINGTSISLISDTLTSFTPLVAKFTTNGKNITIGSTPQVSESTSNSYSTNLVYTVTAQDGSTQNYTVTMTAPRTYGGASALVFWFKADSLALSDGASVQTWNDLSGRGNNIIQGTPSAKPTYKANQVNGFPSLGFTQAGATSMNITGGTGFWITNSGSLFIVMKVIVGGGLTTIGGSNGREFAITATPSWYAGRNGVGPHYTSAFAIPTTGHIAIGNIQVLSSLNTEYWNGDVKGSIASGHDYSGAGSPTDMSFGANIEADIAEFIFFNTALSQNETDKIFCYLRAKYNLTATTTSCGT